MNKFIAQEHREYDNVLLILFTILIAFIVIVALCGRSFALLVLALILSVFCIVLYRSIKRFGLYIDNDELVFRRFLKRQIDFSDVYGLLILKSQIKTRYTKSYIKKQNGDFQYSIIYLKDVRTEFADFYSGNLDFMCWHKEYAHFYTVYDEDIIELFKGKVPIITCNDC